MTAEKLDPREEHFRIAGHHPGSMLFLRHLAPASGGRGVVLYVHGGTFPSALAVAHRFDGRSWRDELCDAGFHSWALDFHGFGRLSDPYPEMELPAESVNRSAVRRTPAASSKALSDLSANTTASRGSRSSPIPGERS